MHRLVVVIGCALLAVFSRSAKAQPDPNEPHYSDNGYWYELGGGIANPVYSHFHYVPTYNNTTNNGLVRVEVTPDLTPQDDHDGGLAGDSGGAHVGAWSRLHHKWTWDPMETDEGPALEYFTGHCLYDGLVDGSVEAGAGSGYITYNNPSCYP